MIALDDVSYGYNGAPLLSRISLDLAPGSFHFLTGPSGAGKTTLLKLCYLELLPDEGRVVAFGQDARNIDRNGVAEVRRRVGVVHQDCRFLDHLPLEENLSLSLAVSGRAIEAHQSELDELMAWVGLSDRRTALPAELSGGERQRAALARALILSPDVILADEPTGNVDWEMSLRLMTLLAELNRMGKAVLIATHDLNLIRQAKSQVPARVLRLKDGHLSAAGASL